VKGLGEFPVSVLPGRVELDYLGAVAVEESVERTAVVDQIATAVSRWPVRSGPYA
jgi:hypothetical protein